MCMRLERKPEQQQSNHKGHEIASCAWEPGQNCSAGRWALRPLQDPAAGSDRPAHPAAFTAASKGDRVFTFCSQMQQR